jgi:hypothetical protein
MTGGGGKGVERNVHHGQQGGHWDENVLAIDVSDFNGAALKERAVVVRVAARKGGGSEGMEAGARGS